MAIKGLESLSLVTVAIDYWQFGKTTNIPIAEPHPLGKPIDGKAFISLM